MTNRVAGIGRVAAGALLAGAAMAGAACDKAQLLAPTRSTITLSAPTRVLPTGGSTELTAFVIEQAGTPVQNGTTVRFSTSLGRVEPVEAQTRNGLAVATFFAMQTSGIARITASSGGATGGTDSANAVEITIGAAAVDTVTLRANPGSVGPNGGSVELVATVIGANGRSLEGISVAFSTDQGTLSASTALTDADGLARVTLATTQKATVSARAGSKKSDDVTVDLRAGPSVSIACTPPAGTGNCAAVQASTSSNTATVVFTVKKVNGSSTIRTATLDFGDGSSQALGNLGGDAIITHTYTGPSGSTSQVYTATVQATDINGESASASTTVTITPKPTPTPINVTIDVATPGSATSAGQRWTFTANVTGGGATGTGDATIESFTWDFGDGDGTTTSGRTVSHVYTTTTEPQRRTVTVTVRTPDGRTATGRAEIIVDKAP